MTVYNWSDMIAVSPSIAYAVGTYAKKDGLYWTPRDKMGVLAHARKDSVGIVHVFPKDRVMGLGDARLLLRFAGFPEDIQTVTTLTTVAMGIFNPNESCEEIDWEKRENYYRIFRGESSIIVFNQDFVVVEACNVPSPMYSVAIDGRTGWECSEEFVCGETNLNLDGTYYISSEFYPITSRLLDRKVPVGTRKSAVFTIPNRLLSTNNVRFLTRYFEMQNQPQSDEDLVDSVYRFLHNGRIGKTHISYGITSTEQDIRYSRRFCDVYFERHDDHLAVIVAPREGYHWQ